MTRNQAKAQLMRKIARKVDEQVHLHQEIVDLVMVGRSPDVDGKCLLTYAEIGELLGMSRQGAQQAFSVR